MRVLIERQDHGDLRRRRRPQRTAGQQTILSQVRLGLHDRYLGNSGSVRGGNTLDDPSWLRPQMNICCPSSAAPSVRYPGTHRPFERAGNTLRPYILDNASTLEYQRLDLMSKILNPWTRGYMSALGVSQDWQCLELGGNGSIAE